MSKTAATVGAFVKHFLCASSYAQSDRDWLVEPYNHPVRTRASPPFFFLLWLNCQRGKGLVGDVWFWQGQRSDEDPSFSSRVESGPLRLNRNAGAGLMNDWKQKPKPLPHAQEGGVALEQQLIESAWTRQRDFR